LAKDRSGIVAYYHLGIFDKPEFFVDYTRRRGGLQPGSCGTIPVFAAGFGASPLSERISFQTRHLLNPVALINREDN
jgi:hypothetical protein